MNSFLVSGTPIFRYFFQVFGVRITAIIYFICTTAIIMFFLFFRNKLTNEKHIRWYYAVIGLLIAWRAWVVGAWIGILTSVMEGCTF